MNAVDNNTIFSSNVFMRPFNSPPPRPQFNNPASGSLFPPGFFTSPAVPGPTLSFGNGFPFTLPVTPQRPQMTPSTDFTKLFADLQRLFAGSGFTLPTTPPVTPPTTPPVTPPTTPPVTPPTTPPVTPPTTPPVTPPTTPPAFVPGQIDRNTIPTDANGQMTTPFLRQLLTPSAPVDTNLFDASSPGGLSKFAKVGLRMLGHDLYDGRIDGDVATRSLLNPTGSNNTAFIRDQATTDITRQWGLMDLNDNGRIDGSAYVKLVEDVWPTTDGVSIRGFSNMNFTPANLSVAEQFRNTPNVESAAGLAQWSQLSGRPITDLENFSLWGHRILTNETTQQIAQGALTNPRAIDFGIVNATPETKAFAQQLVNDPNAKRTVGGGVLNFIQQKVASQ
jgi:hypothetical protein